MAAEHNTEIWRVFLLHSCNSLCKALIGQTSHVLDLRGKLDDLQCSSHVTSTPLTLLFDKMNVTVDATNQS